MTDTVNLGALKRVMQEATKLAKEYRKLTGKQLGITGEVGEFIAADLLHLERSRQTWLLGRLQLFYSHAILISPSSVSNSLSPVISSALRFFASAAAKQSP